MHRLADSTADRRRGVTRSGGRVLPATNRVVLALVRVRVGQVRAPVVRALVPAKGEILRRRVAKEVRVQVQEARVVPVGLAALAIVPPVVRIVDRVVLADQG